MAGINHADVKAAGNKGYATEWNKDHNITGDVDFDGFNITNLADPEACKVTRSANKTLANAAMTIIDFNQEEFDTDGMHDNAVANTRITIIKDGFYLVFGRGGFDVSAVGNRGIGFRLNSETFFGGIIVLSTGGATIAICSDVVYLTAGSYVEFYASQTSGGDLDLLATDTNFGVIKIR